MIDFLGIGAQKAGTSWLMANLRAHPDVWTPFIKELHYFDTLHLDTPKDRNLAKLKKRARRLIRHKSGRSELDAAEKKYLRRIFAPGFAFTDAWYGHIFSAAAPGKIRGEFTPYYCAIGTAGVAHVKQLMPGVRLIYLIRDPVQRTLSALRMWLDRGSKLPDVASTAIRARGDYASHIPVWDEACPGQILYLPFGRIKKDPLGVMRAVEKHIGLAPFDGYEKLWTAVNATQKTSVIPESVVRQVEKLAEPQYPFLERRFGRSFLLETK